MKRIVLSIVAGFLVGFLFRYTFLTPRVLAQSVVDPRVPTNQRFILEDEAHNSVGNLSFDASGIPVIELTGQPGRSLRGHIFRILCEIRPVPLSAAPNRITSY
jgi:hypothetical protein